MAIFNYIDENGEAQEFIVNANDIQALDVEGNYDNKNLEDILETLGEANRVYLVKNEEQIKKGKAGIYFCDEILDNREDNNVVKRIKDYINTIVGDLNNLKTTDKTNLVNAINENTSQLKDCAKKDGTLQTGLNAEKIGGKKIDSFNTIEVISVAIDADTVLKEITYVGSFINVPNVNNDTQGILITKLYRYTDDIFCWLEQIFISAHIDVIYTRHKNNTGWLKWKQIETVDDTGWINLPLGSGITVDSGLTPKYRKVNNQVFICGSILGVDTGNKLVGTLPIGFRPTNNHYFVNHASGGTFNSMTVNTDGQIRIFNNSDGKINTTRYATINTNFII